MKDLQDCVHVVYKTLAKDLLIFLSDTLYTANLDACSLSSSY